MYASLATLQEDPATASIVKPFKIYEVIEKRDFSAAIGKSKESHKNYQQNIHIQQRKLISVGGRIHSKTFFSLMTGSASLGTQNFRTFSPQFRGASRSSDIQTSPIVLSNTCDQFLNRVQDRLLTTLEFFRPATHRASLHIDERPFLLDFRLERWTDCSLVLSELGCIPSPAMSRGLQRVHSRQPNEQLCLKNKMRKSKLRNYDSRVHSQGA
jgi:hypothetical protein